MQSRWSDEPCSGLYLFVPHDTDADAVHQWPGLHKLHEVAPGLSTKVPRSHSLHESAPGASAKWPTSHAKHCLRWELPGMEFAVPLLHGMQALLLLAPRTGLYVPAIHCVNVCRRLPALDEAQ